MCPAEAPFDQVHGPLQAVTPPPLPPPAQPLRRSRIPDVEPYTLVEGPAAWYGADYQHAVQQWAVQLQPTHIAELEAAVAALLAGKVVQDGNQLRMVTQLTKADAPLPSLGPVLQEVQQEVLRGRGFALIKGLPVQRWSRLTTVVAYVAIGLHWGRPVRQNQRAHLVGHVTDVGVDPDHRNPATRIYMTRAAQPWHIDSADLVGLLCLQTAKEGGLSSWASSVTLHNELLKQDPALVRTLAGTWYLDRKAEIPEGKHPYYVLPVMHYHQGHLTTTLNDTYYQLAAARHAEVPPLTQQQFAALDALRAVANRPDVRIDYALEPGDLQLLHNHTIIHTRTAFKDYDDPARRRHLLRLWLAPPAEDRAFPLAAMYAEQWYSTQAGDRGGIRIEGHEDAIPLEAEAGNELAM